MRQLVWHLYYVATAVEASELRCFNQRPDFDDMSSFFPCEIDMRFNILILDMERRLQK
jgi:hypothetical protein